MRRRGPSERRVCGAGVVLMRASTAAMRSAWRWRPGRQRQQDKEAGLSEARGSEQVKVVRPKTFG